MITINIENRRMIAFTGEIVFLDTYGKWSLWYDNILGSIDYLLFQTEELAKSFKDYFDKNAKSLETDKEKFFFYEKIKLKDFIAQWEDELKSKK